MTSLWNVPRNVSRKNLLKDVFAGASGDLPKVVAWAMRLEKRLETRMEMGFDTYLANVPRATPVAFA